MPPYDTGRLVAVRPVRRIGPELPRTADGIPPAPVRTHAQGGPLTPTTPVPAPAPSPTPTPGGTPETGGASAARRTAQSTSTSTASQAIGADAIYCTTAQRFTADLHTPPAIALLSSTLRGRRARGRADLAVEDLDRHLTVRKGGRVVWTNSATVERGKPRLLWLTPAAGGGVRGHAHRDRPGRQLRHGQRHDHGEPSLAAGARLD